MWRSDPDIKDFEDRGLANVKQQFQAANFLPEKHRKAEKWIDQQENRYARRADIKSTSSLVISFFALLFAALSLAINWPAARQWLGVSSDQIEQTSAKRER